MSRIICIDGLIGAGKSTLLRNLSTTFTCFLEPVSEYTLLPQLYQDPQKYGLIFQIQVLVSQFKQSQNFPEQLVLVERCPSTSRYVFAPLLVNERDMDILDRIYKQLKYDVHHTIYLSVPPQVAYRRIQNRYDVDKAISLDYLQRLHEQYARCMSHADIVDATQPPDAVREQVLALIKRTASVFPAE